MLLFKRLICTPHCVLHSFIFIFSFFISLGVPLAASGFGSGYPLLLAAYRQMVVLCLLASPASFLIFHFSFYSASRIRSYPSRIQTPPPVQTIHDQQCGANCLISIKATTRIASTFSHFVQSTKQIGLRAETGTRLCESERRKTSNCLSRRRVFDVQRTSTRSGSAWCVEP